jgi:glutathione S-transferase
MIPVIVTPEGDTVQDTSDILDTLERCYPEPPLYPATPVQRIASYLIELYADEFLVLPALHYRWSFPESATKARADFTAANGAPESATPFADMISGAIGMIGVLPATIGAIEAHTGDLLDALSALFAAQPYILGDRPSLADCALMGPLYAHFYMDAVPGRLLRERAPAVCHWIERMNHPDPESLGAWRADDALAPALSPLLALIGRDAVPLILATARAFEAWADENPTADRLPRVIGMHESALRGVRFQRWTTPYTLWMVQRPRDGYDALPPAARGKVDRALAGTGCEAALAYVARHRVVRRPYKLFLEPRTAPSSA